MIFQILLILCKEARGAYTQGLSIVLQILLILCKEVKLLSYTLDTLDTFDTLQRGWRGMHSGVIMVMYDISDTFDTLPLEMHILI